MREEMTINYICIFPINVNDSIEGDEKFMLNNRIGQNVLSTFRFLAMTTDKR